MGAVAWLVALVLVALLWLGVIERIRFEHDQAVEAALDRNANLAIAHEQKTTASLNSFELLLGAAVVQFQHTRQAHGAFNLADWVRHLGVDMTHIHSIALMDARGLVQASTVQVTEQLFADRAYFQRHTQIQDTRLRVGVPIRGRVVGKWGIPITRRINGPDGGFAGVAYMLVDPAFFSGLYLQTSQGPGDSLALVGVDGITRVLRVGDRITFGDNVRSARMYAELADNPNGSYPMQSPVDGHMRLVSYRSIPQSELIVVVASSEQDVLADIGVRALRYQQAAAGTSVLLVLLAWVLSVSWRRRQRHHEQAQANAARFRALTELSSDWYWATDAQHHFTELSAGVLEATGCAPEQLVGSPPWTLPGFADAPDRGVGLRGRFQSREAFSQVEVSVADAAGRPIYLLLSARPLVGRHGQFVGFQGVAADVTERHLAEDNIHRLAYYDALTGLSNRRALTENLERALHRARRNQSLGAVLFLDLDHFKEVNDSLGHPAGDELLRQVSHRLQRVVREVDRVARLGGDEFVVLLEQLGPGVDAAQLDALRVGEKICEAIAKPFDLSGRPARISTSVGVSLFPQRLVDVDDLLREADTALYRAKAAGRNQVAFFHTTMQSELRDRLALEHALAQALVLGQVQVVQLPRVSPQHQPMGCELSARWVHPQRGEVAPAVFKPLLERTGQADAVQLLLLDEACRLLAAPTPAPHKLPIALPMALKSLLDADLPMRLASRLAPFQPLDQRLQLLLPHAVLNEDAATMHPRLQALRALGVALALDGVGDGVVNLVALAHWPLDELVLSAQWVARLPGDEAAIQLLQVLSVLAQQRGVRLAAQGVDSPAQATCLAAHGWQVMVASVPA